MAKALEAIAADRKDNIPVEARDNIKMFHQDFFTLDPDDKVIQANVDQKLCTLWPMKAPKPNMITCAKAVITLTSYRVISASGSM